MKTLRALGSALIAVTLSSCVLSPGQHMSTRDFVREGSADSSRYQLVPITGKEIIMETAAAPAVAVPQELLDYRPEPYRIGVGDSLYITVWEHPELTSPAGAQQLSSANGRLVRADGTLFYPYVGLVKASGLTVEELRSQISAKLTKYVEKPQVDISVNTYGTQRITMRGAFVKTDPQPITTTPMTLAQAIGTATINTDQADLSGLVLARGGHEYHLDLDALSHAQHGLDDIWLKGGDQVFLPYNDRKQVYVLGEVNHPLAIPFKTTALNLTQALGAAGGLSQITSKGRAVYVIRGVEDMEKEPATIYQLDAHSPAAFALASQFAVHPGDVVFVGAADITRWNRVLSQLLPLSDVIQNAAIANRDFGTNP
ncbi:MAG TPA: polysaccharide biosynthesis/export family protein [Xanthomonadaceae bacterium]|jgi:polysaccharide export outer membrane protein